MSVRSKEFFTEQGIEVLDWPSKSPDLNPIENLRSILSRVVYANGKQYDSVPELQSALQRAWSRLSLDLMATLVRSMSRRCVEVLEQYVTRHY